MKFDVVVGNPPYHKKPVGGNNSRSSIYNHFYELAEKIAIKYCLISPARFLFNAGKTPKGWNEKMLNDKHLKIVYFEQNLSEVFPNTDIKGGIVIIQRDSQKKFGKIGVFTTFKELNTILEKVTYKTTKTLDTVISNRGQYRYSNLIYNKYPKEMLRTSDPRIAPSAFERFPEFFKLEKPKDNYDYIQIIGRIDGERVYKWFKRDYLIYPISFEKFKVIIPKANGSGAIGEVLSTPLVGGPLVGFTETFISIGAFENKLEAENCLKYVKSKFARTMLGVLKVTQNNSKETWECVPLQDFTENSDINWTQSIPDIDRQLYKKYNLDENEINFIEEKVKEMS